jgi:hypothetical protein
VHVPALKQQGMNVTEHAGPEKTTSSSSPGLIPHITGPGVSRLADPLCSSYRGDDCVLRIGSPLAVVVYCKATPYNQYTHRGVRMIGSYSDIESAKCVVTVSSLRGIWNSECNKYHGVHITPYVRVHGGGRSPSWRNVNQIQIPVPIQTLQLRILRQVSESGSAKVNPRKLQVPFAQ